MEGKGFCRHGKQPHQCQTGTGPGRRQRPDGKGCSQQQEQGQEKQTVAGVVPEAEGHLIQNTQSGQAARQTVIAVPAQAEEVEYPGDSQAPASVFCQSTSQRQGQQQGGQVPQMVEGTIENQVPPGDGIAGIDVQGQIRDRRKNIQHQGMPPQPPGVLPVLPGQKIPADHGKIRHCHPGQHPGEPQIRHR